MSSGPGPELATLIGEEALVRLAEAFGGTRLYVPAQLPAGHAIVRAIGADAAALLVERYAPDAIRVPVARELRARHYRARNMSQARIARALGVTESGVYRLLRRLDERDGSPQMSLFGEDAL